MAVNTISSAKTVAYFTIITGVAAGIATYYLANKFSEKTLDKSTVTTGIIMAVIFTALGATVIKEA